MCVCVNIYFGMKILWIYFWGSLLNSTSFMGSFLCILGSFLTVNVQRVAEISNIFGVLDIPNIFYGKHEILGPSLRMQKKREYPTGCCVPFLIWQSSG